MPPKRKVAAVADDDDEFAASQAGQPMQAPLAIDVETADTIASKLCRFVLLREHLRKPIARAEMKTAVMSEHNDRSGKIFKQVLAAVNAKLHDLAGLELVQEAASSVGAGDDEVAGADGGGTQSQSQSQAVAGGASKAGGAKTTSYLLVNVLPDPVRTELADAPAVYHAFIEVVLSFLQQSDGTLDEERLFGYLAQIGLERKECLPHPAEQEKVENLVQKRLVSEAWLRRQKKANGGADEYVYVAGARATLSRRESVADEFRDQVLRFGEAGAARA